MTLSKEVKAGLLVTVAIALLIVGFNFLKGKNIFVLQRHFYAVYDNVDGVVEANPVLVNGYQVGQVASINFTPDYSGKIYVEFLISDNDLKIPANSIMKIISPSILGGKAVELELGNDQSVLAENGDTLLSSTEESVNQAISRQLVPLKDKAESLISSIDSVMIIIRQIFNEQNQASINKSLSGLKTTVDEISLLVDDERERLSLIIRNVESITNNFKNNNEKLSNAMRNISAISDSVARSNLSSAVNNAGRALNETALLLDKVNKGEGSLGKLVHNDSLYNGLNHAAEDLDKLLEDMRLHPKRYVHFSVFGKKEKEKDKTK